MRKMKQVLLVCMLGVVVFAHTGCGSKTIDLNKYVTIEAKGYDSMGTVNCTFDYEAIEKDYDGKIKANVKSSKLFNGDKITVTASVQGSVDSFVKQLA